MCGVFGAVARTRATEEEIGPVGYIGLLLLQHRGEEGAGMSAFRGGSIQTHRAMGTVKQVFRPDVTDKALTGFSRNQSDTLSFEEATERLGEWRVSQHDLYRMGGESAVVNPPEEMKGVAVIGHTRYSTRGASGSKNLHPIPFEFHGKPGAIAHNGTLQRLEELRNTVLARNPKFSFKGETDTELIAALLATSPEIVFKDALAETLPLLVGAFSLVILHDGVVYAVRDSSGIRPLFWARTDKYYLVASETCAFDVFNVQETFEVNSGSIVRLEPRGVVTTYWTEERSCRDCVFEKIYLARPDSIFSGKSTYAHRLAMGRMLALEHKIPDADVVVPVIDSGTGAAHGYAEASGILLSQALVRGRVEERTFIQPNPEDRKNLQRLKLNPIRDQINGLHVVLVDDSIVRGTTTTRLIKRVRRAGARKVSILSASPPIRFSCHLGVDTPYPEDLIAHQRTVEEVRKIIGADYLGYLSIDGLHRAIGSPPSQSCDGCMTGKYPVAPEKSAIAG